MSKQYNQILHVGDRIKCKNWKDLKATALNLSAEGYGVTCIGFSDISDDILTITAVPEQEEDTTEYDYPFNGEGGFEE